MEKNVVGWQDPNLLKPCLKPRILFMCVCVCVCVVSRCICMQFFPLAAEWKQQFDLTLQQVDSSSHLGPLLCHRQSFLLPKLYFEASSRKFKTAGFGEKNKKCFVQHIQFESCQEILLLPFHYTLLWRNHFFFFYKVRRILSQEAVHN